MPENFVADVDQILQKQIVDLERATSASPLPRSLTESPALDLNKPERPSTLDLQEVKNDDRSQNYEVDALGGDDGMQYPYLRHSPIDSDLDTSSISSYSSLSPHPKKEKKTVMFKDENEAFEYFRVKHYDRPYMQPDVISKQQSEVTMEPPPTPSRGSSKSRTLTRMFCDESDALDYFKIEHFPKCGNNQEYIRTRQEYIEQLNNYTPRIQPAVPKRKDSSEKFQKKLVELSRLSAACGEVADQIKHDHQVYWGALTEEYKVPDPSEASLLSEAYQRISMGRGTHSTAMMGSDTHEAFSSPPDRRKAVQSDMKSTGMISVAVSDNIVNMASSVNQMSSSQRTVRNEIRIDVTPSPEVRAERPPPVCEGQGQSQGKGFWNTSPASHAPRLKPQNHKRSVTWCDDLTSTDDDRMSDSSTSLTPERKLDPASSLKSIQKTHSIKKKKKKVSWSDDYNTDDDRHSSSTSLSSVFEPNSPEIPRHISNYGPTPTSPLTYRDGRARSPNTFQRNISWPASDFVRNPGQQTVCLVYGQPLLAASRSNQQASGSSGFKMAQSQIGPAGSAKTSIGVQRFKVENKFPVPKPQTTSPKPLPFPVETATTKFNGHSSIKHQQFKC